METTKDKESAGENKSGAGADGFDFKNLLNDPKIGELIKHLLSGGGAVLFSHLFSIKPMQEKIEVLTDKNKKLEERIEELEKTQRELIEELNEKLKSLQDPHDGNEEYFTIRNKGKRKKLFN